MRICIRGKFSGLLLLSLFLEHTSGQVQLPLVVLAAFNCKRNVANTSIMHAVFLIPFHLFLHPSSGSRLSVHDGMHQMEAANPRPMMVIMMINHFALKPNSTNFGLLLLVLLLLPPLFDSCGEVSISRLCISWLLALVGLVMVGIDKKEETDGQ